MENLEEEDLDNEDSQGDTSSKLERYKQQMKGSKDEAIKLKQELEKVSKEKLEIAVQRIEADPEYIKSLAEKDPNFANEVAKQFEGFDSADEFIEKHLGGKSGGKGKTLEEKITERVLAQLGQKTTLDEIDQKFSHLGEDQKKIAKEKFDKLRGGKNLTSSDATELAEMITLHLQKDKIVESARQSKVNSIGNLNLGGVAVAHSLNQNSGAGIASTLGLGYLYTNKK